MVCFSLGMHADGEWSYKSYQLYLISILKSLHIVISEHTHVHLSSRAPGDSTHIISELWHPGFLAIVVEWIQRQIAAVVDRFWAVRISEALKRSVNIFNLINTEMWEMINAFLSCSHSFPDFSITSSYHFNTAIWHRDGNCPSVTVHLSPFFNIRI